MLATVIILVTLAAVAVPSYTRSRRIAAAQACKENMEAIAGAELAYSQHYGGYVGATSYDTSTWSALYTAGTSGASPTGGLLGAPDALNQIPTCPRYGSAYQVQVSSGVLSIRCQDRSQHSTDTGMASTTWELSRQPVNQDTTSTTL